MSYDLFMKPRKGDLDHEAFAAYFTARPLYDVQGDKAWYRNRDTGTYFLFEFQEAGSSEIPADEDGETGHPLIFNINYFRPSFFGPEAEPEVLACIRHFDLTVEDPQVDDEMGVGEYDSAKFLSGWAKGNEAGYRAVLEGKIESAAMIPVLPGREIRRIWKWNLHRKERQAQVGDHCFVPILMFHDLGGVPKTFVVWPDGIPSLLPRADFIFINRKDLAPKRLFRRVPDNILVPWSELEGVITRFSSPVEGPAFRLNYASRPPDLAKAIERIPAAIPDLKRLSPDSVLDAELVAKYS